MEREFALDERDKAIAARLLRFREETRIPRTTFALSIGIGGERLASYEKGRVRLKYLPVHRMMEQYKLSPLWLATGEGEPFVSYAFDASDLISHLPPGALFTWVFDNLLHERIKTAATKAARDVQTVVNGAWELAREFKDPYFAKGFSTHDIQRWLDAEERLTRALREQLLIRGVETLELTTNEKPLEVTPVKSKGSLVRGLIEDIKRLTTARGSRAALARALDVPPQRLNDWLSGEHEPSAEITLRLRDWADSQAKQQKSSDRALTQSEPKRPKKRNRDENRNSGRKSKSP